MSLPSSHLPLPAPFWARMKAPEIKFPYLARVGRGRKIFSFLLFCQAAIVITGGIVRITGSGLGCPTWPECSEGSLTPSAEQLEDPLHIWIEFGNRLLTFVLAIAAIGALGYAIRLIPNFRVRLLALLQFLGIVGQAVLGGITVLTGLHPATVAAHFMLSILLIAGALSLRQRVYGKVPNTLLISALTRALSKVLLVLGFTLIFFGTLVTGSGPHAGDATSPRFDFDLRIISWIHADLLILFLGTIFATLISIRLGEAGESRARLGRLLLLLIAASLLQGLIGYIQYFTGVPEVLVILHLLGAILVWLSLWNFFIAGSLSSVNSK